MRVVIMVALLMFLFNVVASANDDQPSTPPLPPWDKTILV